MKTDPSPEIIEIIDDDGDVFGDHAMVTPPIPATGSARWIGPAAAAVLLLVAGFGVVSSFVDSKPPPPSTPGLIKSQFYVSDPPTGFTMYLAQARGQAGADPATFADEPTAELWATADATATTGAWFVVSLGSEHSTGRNSYRTIVDGAEVVFEHDPASGQTRVAFTKNGTQMSITSFGWLDRQLVRLLRSVNAENSVIGYSDAFFTTDHTRILQTDPAAAMFGLPVARVGYATGVPSELATHFSITVAGDNISNEREVARFALVDTSSFTIGTETAIVGRTAADPSIAFAQWHDGERLISVTGNLDTAHIEAIARKAHKASEASVHRQLTAGAPPTAPALRDTPSTVVSGMLADGWRWTIGVSPSHLGPAGTGFLWWIGQPGDSTTPSETRISDPGGAPSIDTFVEHGRTYVLASVPRSMAGARLHVSPTGSASIVTYFGDADPNLPELFGAWVFTQPATFTARIVDANGATVASWPTFGRAGS